MKNYLKKILCTVAAAFGSVAAFAQEQSGGGIDVSAANSAMTQAQTALTGFVTSNAPVISAILGAFLGLTLIFVAYGWIRRASKGR